MPKTHFEGVSIRNSQSIVRQLVRQGKRWQTTPEIRQEVLDFVVDTIRNPDTNQYTALKAIDHLLKMELMNQVDDRIENEGVSGNAEPQVVLLLPPNGTEVK